MYQTITNGHIPTTTNNSLEVGLTINEKKTKYPKCAKKRYQDRELKYKKLIYRVFHDFRA